jgi:hypothetical protein
MRRPALKQLRLSPIWLLILSLFPAFAQRKVDLRNTYERLVCVVPMIGAGTPSDPRRPMYAPVPGGQPSRDGIIAFSYQLSDDGKFALVEFVARDHAGLAGILADKDLRTDVKVFEKAKTRRADIEKEFRRHKKDFDFSRFGVSVP